jgi:hypothetical protein
LTSRFAALQVSGLPEHVATWAVARIPGFVQAVLARWEREHGRLPRQFSMVMCPQAELTALGGLPAELHALTDPRLRCHHFTGCHRPYLVVLFTGDEAETRRAAVLALLPWSEGYAVTLDDDRVSLSFAGANESVAGDEPAAGTRSLRSLLESGELVQILD